MNADRIVGAPSVQSTRYSDDGAALGGSAWRLRRRTASVAAAIACVVLQACGGGSTSDVTPQPAVELPTLSGLVADGAGVSGAQSFVTVKGTVGAARTTNGAQIDGQDYVASLDQLTGPYLLANFRSNGEFGLVSVATAKGTANLTPLTTLLFAQLLGTDPISFFGAYVGQSANFTVDAAALQTADLRVRRYLQRELGFTVPATLGDFVTTPFNKVAGDPMYDTITALTTRIGDGGDYRVLAAAVGQEAGRCKLEKVVIVSGGVTDEFCPFSKTNEFEEADSTVQAIGFVNSHGDTLTVRVRGSDVLTAQLRTAEGASSQCSGAGCVGIALGTPAGDLTRPITFTAVTLTGAQGTARVDGTLATSVPGIALPGLPCTANRYYLIKPDNTAVGYCAGPDDFGVGQGGSASPYGLTRLRYFFNPVTNDAVSSTLIVSADGGTVHSIAAINSDGVTPPYVCAGAGCGGATIGVARTDTSAGFEVQLRSMTFADVVLHAVQPDGSLSETDTLTLRAELVGGYAPQPSVSLVPCADPAQSLAVQTSDSGAPVAICVPADSMGNTLTGTFLDGDGNIAGFFLQNLLTDGNGSFSTGDSVTVSVAVDGSVASVSYGDHYGVSYGCSGGACSGVTVSAPNGAGERTVTLAATPLTEQAGIAATADRSATVSGSFVAPAPQ